MSMDWQGVDDMLARLQAYQNGILSKVKMVAYKYAAIFEAYAKREAKWTDRTANARQSLHTWVEELSQDTVRLYLSGGVSYQIFLETRFAARYAIIWPTIQRHLPEIREDLQGIFS